MRRVVAWNVVVGFEYWIPAFAGMTLLGGLRSLVGLGWSGKV